MTRADRLEELLARRGLDALLVTDLVNVRYLTGYTGTNGVALVGPGRRTFLTDFRYVTQAAEQVPDFERVQGRLDLLGDAADRMRGRVGFEAEHLSVRRYERLRGLTPAGVELVPTAGLVERLRLVKEPTELAAIAAAAQLADAALERVLERGLRGRTERAVAVELEREMRELGAEEPSFPSIVAAGAHGSLPHAEPREAQIAAGGLVTIDWGARLDGYCSDCTRTFAVGDAPQEAIDVYELVLRAQRAASVGVRPGELGRTVDAIARDSIDAAGHGEHFGHGLGHGVGLEVHEGPRLSRGSDDRLEPGMVVTVEPGVYVPERLGVRIEDLVVVRDGGAETLSGLPKDLQVVQ